MKQMNPAEYDAAHQEMLNSLIQEYSNLNVDEVGRVYAESRLQRERNTKWRNESTIFLTHFIAKNTLEEKALCTA